MRALQRTQIYLKRDQMRQLKQESETAGIAMSEVIREALDEHLSRRRAAVDWQHDPLTRLMGNVRMPDRDASERHDDILYGTRKRRTR